jgi:hypothetical protein
MYALLQNEIVLLFMSMIPKPEKEKTNRFCIWVAYIFLSTIWVAYIVLSTIWVAYIFFPPEVQNAGAMAQH